MEVLLRLARAETTRIRIILSLHFFRRVFVNALLRINSIVTITLVLTCASTISVPIHFTFTIFCPCESLQNESKLHQVTVEGGPCGERTTVQFLVSFPRRSRYVGCLLVCR